MLEAQFAGAETYDYTNKTTGEVGTGYKVSFLTDEGVRTIRVPVELYKTMVSIPMLAKVRIRFGFAVGRFDHFATVVAVERIAEPGGRAA